MTLKKFKAFALAMFFLLSLTLASQTFIPIAKAADFSKIINFLYVNKNTHNYYMIDVTMNSDIRLSNENGYSLNSEICNVNKFSVSYGNAVGEWDQKGGFTDTPPIVFVSDLEGVVNKIQNSGRTLWQEVTIDGFHDGYVDPVIGIPLYYFKACSGWRCEGTWIGSLVCELKSQKNDIGGVNKLGNNYYQVSDVGQVELDITYDIDCIFHIWGYQCTDNHPCQSGSTDEKKFALFGPIVAIPTTERCDYCTPSQIEKLPGVNHSPYNIGYFGVQKTMKVSNDYGNVSISIKPVLTENKLKPHFSTPMKVLITNDGNKEASVKNIQFNVDSKLLACTSSKLLPGETTECVLEINPTKSGDVKMDLTYQSYKCGERKIETQSVYIGSVEVECAKDSDCNGGYGCCEGVCYDVAKGVCKDINGDGTPDWAPYY